MRRSAHGAPHTPFASALRQRGNGGVRYACVARARSSDPRSVADTAIDEEVPPVLCALCSVHACVCVCEPGMHAELAVARCAACMYPWPRKEQQHMLMHSTKWYALLYKP